MGAVHVADDADGKPAADDAELASGSARGPDQCQPDSDDRATGVCTHPRPRRQAPGLTRAPDAGDIVCGVPSDAANSGR